MCDVEFSNLYIVAPQDTGETLLSRKHFGRPDPPHDRSSCKRTPRSPP
jgi:hypothetical protein